MRYLKIGAAALATLVLVGLIAVIAHDRLSQPPAPASSAGSGPWAWPQADS